MQIVEICLRLTCLPRIGLAGKARDFGCLLALSLVALLQASAHAEPFRVAIQQLPDGAGSVSYGVRIPNISVFFGGGTVVAPDGTVFGLGPSDSPQVFDLSFTELQTLAVGEWTINDTFGLPPTASNVHHFSIFPFTLADVFSDVPNILTPAEGAEVPRTFNVTWEWPLGVVPAVGQAISIGGAAGGVDSTSTGPTSYSVEVGFDPGVVSDLISVRVGGTQSLPALISDITQAPPGVGRNFEPLLTFSSLSASRSLTVLNVPEPATWISAFFSMMAMLYRRSIVGA